MTDLTTLKALRERVRGATGRLDDETLGRLICAVNGVSFGSISYGCGDDGSVDLNIRSEDGRFDWYEYRRLAPDACLDATVALVERLLPGWYWEVCQNNAAMVRDPSKEAFACADHVAWHGECSSRPLALLSALLTALISQAEEKEGADV